MTNVTLGVMILMIMNTSEFNGIYDEGENEDDDHDNDYDSDEY